MRPIDADELTNTITHTLDAIEGLSQSQTECVRGQKIGLRNARKMMVEAPTLDVQPVVHAHWIKGGKAFIGVHKVDEYICSLCDYHTLEEGNYCGNCGAIMDEEIGS